MSPLQPIQRLLSGRVRSGRDGDGQSEEAAQSVTDGGVAAPGPAAPAAAVGLGGTMADRSVHDLLDAVPMPLFALDASHTVVAWNYGVEQLYGRSREEVLGTTEYVGRDEDGNPRPTLADEVLEAGGTVPDEYDAEEEAVTWLEGEAITGAAWVDTASGAARYFRIIVSPVYEGDELVGVVEFFQDRTETIRRQETNQAAVAEINETLSAIGRGDLAERVDLSDLDDRHLNEHLDAVTDGINRNAAALEGLVDRVEASTAELVESARETADHAAGIADLAADQTRTLRHSADEVGAFSANMEEVAANAESVAEAARSARRAAETGREAGADARAALDGITDQAAEQRESVSALAARMDDVESVVTIIDDIADQTNLLALNANIEAARADAGSGGAGFAVVAEEVKQLAEETKARTGEIADHVEDVREGTRRTTDAVAETGQLIEESRDPFDAALSALEEIATAVEDVSASIQEVADANDDQAETAEEVAAAIDDVEARAGDVEERSEEIRELAEGQRSVAEDLAEQVDRIGGGMDADATTEADR